MLFKQLEMKWGQHKRPVVFCLHQAAIEREQREGFSLDYSFPQDTQESPLPFPSREVFCGLGETRTKVLQEAWKLHGEGLKLFHNGGCVSNPGIVRTTVLFFLS